ncbi:sulfatase family protein [Streptomyces malaysiensis]|uniref:Sulfatase n=1 Tax=Streptomyces malaysiensis subsp. samsunensis TaxID=459658 RepID=A0A9X2RRY5_STRMQ|nr:sulfatase [Streptomyces samsunensis]MCQ8828657.1 sulfatase [Streptomyces samsunensis]
MFGSRRPRVLAALCAALAIALLASCARVMNTADEGGSADADASRSGKKPNIVYVLTDDLAWNLVEYMPHVQRMREKGTTFTNFFATDSLCCPSRTSLLTGQYPHNTGVFTNGGDDGGYRAFMKNRNEEKTFGPALQRAGYRTGFMGKYLNGYQPEDKNGTSKPYVPSGRDEWDVAGAGYNEYDYDLNENGKVVPYGKAPEDYLTDVLSKKATSFIGSSAAEKKPFMLEVATFAPHGPYTPAPRDKDKFPGLEAPRTDAYDKATGDAPKWQSTLSPLTAEEKQGIDRKFAKRVRSVQAVDAMIGQLEKTLEEKGLADDTYLMFGSDNGFHMGEHRLRPGKQTAYDTDVKVPMMVTGPDVPAGEKVSRLAENVDLNPTFLDLAGVAPPSTVDGRSLSDLMHGRTEEEWREAVLVEHHHSTVKKDDPDAAPEDSGDPPTYGAIRTEDSLYVEYVDGQREFYALDSDPEQLTNRAAALSPVQRDALHRTLTELQRCKGAESCQAAARTHTS